MPSELLPALPSKPFATERGTAYLKEPGVAMLAAPMFCFKNVELFLDGFSHELGFDDYIYDTDPLYASDHLVKFAGQLCYMSFDRNRTRNADCSKYMTNIKSSGHGSVLEHPSFSFLIWGISRSLTHELVRHRIGVAYSQVSQRYVSGKSLRFVERPEYAADPELHVMFEARIDRAAFDYNNIAATLLEKQKAGSEWFSSEKKAEARKKVNQCARSCLPNETEAPIVFSANVRALRHILEMRVAGPAEIEIRRMGYKLYACTKLMAPTLFEDYEVEALPDGTPGLKTPYRKV